MVNQLIEDFKGSENLDVILNNREQDGSFKNLNYSDTTPWPWDPLTHVDYFNQMVLSMYINQDNSTYQDILTTLDFWLNKNFTSYLPIINNFVVPSTLVIGCLVLSKTPNIVLDQSYMDRIRPVLDQDSPTTMPISVAKYQFQKSLFYKNETLLNQTISIAKGLLSFSAGKSDGIKVDGSYLSNGGILYNGFYGEYFMYESLTIISTCNGTIYNNFNNSNLEVMSTLSLHGNQWMSYAHNGSAYWLQSSDGRDITAYDGTHFLYGYSLLKKSPIRNEEFLAWVTKLNGTDSQFSKGNRQFWTSDFMVHSRSSYLSSVKFTSKLTKNSECLNGDGRVTQKIADGAFFLIYDGYEYDNVYPLWDWQMVPGITSEINRTVVPCGGVPAFGTTSFDGSLSDGIYGLAAMDLAPSYSPNLRGKKSWFFFDEQIVFVGSNISTTTPNNAQLITSIEQRVFKQPLYTSASINTPKDTFDLSSIEWYHHDKTAVMFYNSKHIASTPINIGPQSKTGSWQQIGSSYGNVDGTVLLSYLNYTNVGQQNSYQYIIIPNIEYSNFTNKKDSLLNSIDIMKSDDLMHAVHHQDLKLLQIVFWQPTSSGKAFVTPYAFNITTSSAILLQVNLKNNSFYQITVSDPTQTLSTVTIVFEYLELSGPFCKFSSNTNYSTLTITLPSGNFAGSSIINEYKVLSHPIPGTDSSDSANLSSDSVNFAPNFVPNFLGDEFSTIVNNQINIFKNTISSKDINTIMSNLNDDGSFKNLNYNDSSVFPWDPMEHLTIWSQMVVSLYNTPQDANVFSKILLPLDYWFANNFTNPIPILNNFLAPYEMLKGSLLLSKLPNSPFNQTYLDKVGPVFSQSKPTTTQVSIDNFNFLKALLYNDTNEMAKQLQATWDLFQFAPGQQDGLKVDGSLLRDGILYNGFYGNMFFEEAISMVIATNGTQYSIPKEKLDIIATLTLQGNQWMSYAQGGIAYWLQSSVGREITEDEGTLYVPNLYYFEQCPVRNAEFLVWKDKVTGKDPHLNNGNRQFWTSDFMIHSRSNYISSVKFTSKRTKNGQCDTKDGGVTQKIADGAFFLMYNGSEYREIYPIWDWQLIPGITSEINNTLPNCGDVSTYGTTAFDGSLSDGIYGLAAMDLAPSYSPNLRGKKSWFFFDEQIVFIGSNISTSSNNVQLFTSIEQRVWKQPLYTSLENSVDRNTFNQTSIDWYHHDKTAVIFPRAKNSNNSTQVYVGPQSKKGSWESIGSSSGGVDGTVLLAYLNHTVGGYQNSYQYIIIPNIEYSNFTNRKDSLLNSIEIMKSDDLIHAVHHQDLKLLQIVFWQPTSSGKAFVTPYAFNITTSSAILLQVNLKNSSFYQITVSDPTQTLSTVTIVFRYLELSGPFCKFSSKTNYSTLAITLPSGNFAGSSIINEYKVLSHPVPGPNSNTDNSSEDSDSESSTTSTPNPTKPSSASSLSIPIYLNIILISLLFYFY